MTPGDKQIKIIEDIKLFLESVKLSNIDASLSSFCYFTSWSETPGYARLKLKNDGWLFLIKFFKILLKNILTIASHSKYEEIVNKPKIENCEVMVVSWCYKQNFCLDGSFQDRYFNENSENLAKSFWILISMDGYVPPNLKNNIKILRKKSEIFKYNFFALIRILLSTIIDCRFSPKKIFHYLFFHSYFAKLVTSIVKKDLKKNKFRAILLPYEAQPFQNKLFSETKKINEKIINIGYLHSLPPLTSELIYRSGAPDLLMVHGENQIKILKKMLNWPEKKLILIKSLRFRLSHENLSNKIYIPLSLHDEKKFIKEFKKLLINSPKNYFPKFNIKNHPAIYNSKKHLKFQRKLEEIIKIYGDRFSSDSKEKNISIFFGVTAAVLEALERGVEVIHICSDPVFQSYSEKIWHNIETKKIDDLVFKYNLNLKGKFIDFDDNTTLSSCLKLCLN